MRIGDKTFCRFRCLGGSACIKKNIYLRLIILSVNIIPMGIMCFGLISLALIMLF
jgi:hypothetical protein